ncbi:MAG TPA: aminotransferase class V-fold PLP-dependent enzyme [Acidimicrobiia bacterium]
MWSLSPDVRHLNHGSFGAVPIPVQERQTEWHRRWEANPTAFVHNELGPALATARLALAGFVGADAAGLVFVRNASQGVASVLGSVAPTLVPGDEILTTDHDYNAVRQTLEHTAARVGAVVRVVPIPFPIDTPDTAVDAVLGAVGERTRLLVIDHVTSPTGLLLPIDRIVAELEPDVPVLVDGAHGPGQLALDLDGLGASWYTGNLHKWVCAPKGAAFLHTRADRVESTVPTVISHGWNHPPAGTSRYHALFDWTGTDDFTSWLVVPDAIEVVGGLETGGWPALIDRNHHLVSQGRDVLCEMLGIGAPAPDEMVGSMAGVPLGDHEGGPGEGLLSPLTWRLLDAGFESVVSFWPASPAQVIRLSAHHYNTLAEYEALARWLSEEGVGTAPRPDRVAAPHSG